MDLVDGVTTVIRARAYQQNHRLVTNVGRAGPPPRGRLRKEVSALRRVTERTAVGDGPGSLCVALSELHGADEPRLATGARSAILDAVLDTVLHTTGPGFEKTGPVVLLIGCGSAGCTALRAAGRLSCNRGHLVVLEADPLRAALAICLLEWADLSGSTKVWVGHCDILLPRVRSVFGQQCITALILSPQGAKYHEHLSSVEQLGLLADGALVLADGVLFPAAAPELLWRLVVAGPYAVRMVEVPATTESNAYPGEVDWMVIARLERSEDQSLSRSPCPEGLLQLAYEADEVAWRSSTSWSPWAAGGSGKPAKVNSRRVQQAYKAAGIKAAILRPQYCGDRWSIDLGAEAEYQD